MLTRIVFPFGLQSIKYQAFGGCISLTSIEIPSSVTYFDSISCKDYKSLTRIEIPSSVTSIKSLDVEGCSSLVSPKFPPKYLF